MTDSLEPRTDDELVSAVLDGVASPAEIDRVMGDPELAATLDAYRAVGTEVAAPAEPLTDDTVDLLVARALEEYDPLGDTEHDEEAAPASPLWTGELPQWSDHQGPGRPVDQIRKRRAGKAPRQRRIPPFAIAAALVVLAGLGLFLALSARSDNNTHRAATGSTTNTASGELSGSQQSRSADAANDAPLDRSANNGTAGAPTAGAGSPAGTGSVAGTGAAAGTATSTIRYLGNYAGDDDLSLALAKLDPRTLEGTVAGDTTHAPYVPTPAEITRCDSVIRGHIDRSLTNRLAVAGTTSAGRNLIVTSYDAPATKGQPAGVLIVVANSTSCYPVLTQTH